jgi:hypothetical protein
LGDVFRGLRVSEKLPQETQQPGSILPVESVIDAGISPADPLPEFRGRQPRFILILCFVSFAGNVQSTMKV